MGTETGMDGAAGPGDAAVVDVADGAAVVTIEV